jgi:peptidoglycan/LPS O-acetylase OafA/YrhL
VNQPGSASLTAPAPPAAPERAPDRRRQFACFDGLRAIAALGVLLCHLGFQTAASYTTRAGPYLARLDSGVSVFFLISGFLLYRPFVAARLTAARPVGTGGFYVRRVARIFPAYWLALTGVIVFFGLRLHGPRDVLTFYALAQIYDKHRYLHGISQAWTLATEVSFYAFLPLYAWAIGRVTRRLTVEQRLWAEIAAVITLGVAGFAFRVGVDYAHGTFSLLGIYWLPSWLDLFAIGMLLAVLSVAADAGLTFAPLARRIGRRPGWCWAAAAATFWIAATRLHLPRGLEPLSPRRELAKHLSYAAVALFLLLPAVFGPEREGRIRRFLGSGVMVFLGTISYGIYLWHQAWIEQARRWTGVDLSRLGGNAWLVGVVALAGTVATAALSWHAVEQPVLAIVRRKTSRRREAVS